MASVIEYFQSDREDLASSDAQLGISEAGFEFYLIRCEEADLKPRSGTHYGFIYRGSGTLETLDGRYPVGEGMYFSAPGEARVSVNGAAIVVSQNDYCGIFGLGGPIEQEGRLRYIDGCSDTLLISPVVKGDACLNFLKIPPATNQTYHTHPSFRFGIIVAGAGWCDSPDGSQRLREGTVFHIPSDGVHRFRTESESLSVIAFHPDSDFGPEDDNHPMVNKTIVNGVSAAELTHAERRISTGSKTT